MLYHFNQGETAATIKRLICETYGENEDIVSVAVRKKQF